jgi:hypothetical protein
MKKSIKKQIGVIGVLLFILGISTSCRKKTLDFESGVYTVKELLKSANCDAACGTIADCEGREVHIKGLIDEDNINEEQSQFFIYDATNSDYNISVSVALEIKDAVFEKLEGNGGKEFEVTATIKAYDAPTNFTCDRKFGLELSDVDNLIKK